PSSPFSSTSSPNVSMWRRVTSGKLFKDRMVQERMQGDIRANLVLPELRALSGRLQLDGLPQQLRGPVLIFQAFRSALAAGAPHRGIVQALGRLREGAGAVKQQS